MNYGSKVFQWLILGLELQFFLTLISFPILVYWGLPISLASPAGNLFFGPFLTLFLLLSSLIFFCELFYLPNQLLIYLLEKLTIWWGILLNAGSYNWLVGFAVPFKPLLLIPFVSAFLIFFVPVLKKSGIRCLYLMGMFIISVLLFKLIARRPEFYCINYKNAALLLACKNNHITLVDGGVFARQKNYQSFIEFNLMPELNKIFGTTTIMNVLCLKPTPNALKCLTTLCQCVPLGHVYIPPFSGTLDHEYQQVYSNLKRQLEKQKVQFNVVHPYPFKIACFTIEQLPKVYNYKNVRFNHHRISMDNGNQMRTDQ